jgi:hypothetical protein
MFMVRWITRLAVTVACAGLLLPAGASAQTPKESELKAEVPALTAMHEVIMPMWHDAWPKKDTAALAGMLLQIKKHAAAVAKAELPGILRDKANVWLEGVRTLQASVADYKTAVNAKDDAALLKAAEKLHSDYEALGKIVRPVLKEMDDFHGSLYVLYHYQLTPFDKAGATESIKALKTKMDALNAAALPDRLKARQDAFTAQRARLSKAVDELVSLMTGAEESRIRQGIEQMHIEYEKLEKVF